MKTLEVIPLWTLVPGEFNCAEEVVGERPDELQFLGLQVGARLGDVLMSHPRKKV